MQLNTFLVYTGGKLLSGPSHLSLFPVCTDTRKIRPGDVFVALQGPNFNGNRFAEDAVAKGAKALILSDTQFLPPEVFHQQKVSVISLPDPMYALGILGKECRSQSRAKVIGVTGSVGKSTTKEAVASALSIPFNVRKSQASWNNEIGIPLTFLESARDSEAVDVFVLEMGMRKRGDIYYLCAISQPEMGIITHTAPAHIGLLGSMREIVRAKAELLDALPADGTAFLNADDRYFPFYSSQFSGKKWCVSRRKRSGNSPKLPAEIPCVHWQNVGWLEGGRLVFSFSTPKGSVEFPALIPGFSVGLSLAFALAIGCALNLSLETIVKGLEKLQSLPHRLQILPLSENFIVIDDTYNANPTSMKSAIEFVGEMGRRKGFEQKWAILGDMLELGEWGEKYHRALARQLKRWEFTRFWSTGELMAHAVEEAKRLNIPALHFPTLNDLLREIAEKDWENSIVLVKGSRAMQLDRVVEEFERITGGRR